MMSYPNCSHSLTVATLAGRSFSSGNTLLSDEGPQQGDPLGPLLFCASIMSLVKRVKSQCNIWYMDDGTLGGEVETLLEDFRMLTLEGKNLGLVVNIAKCEVITDDEEVLQKIRDIAPSIQHVSTASAMLLGAPIGGNKSINDVLTDKLHKLHRLSSRLRLLNAHDALFLLKNCFSIPKLMYTLRSAPCYKSQLLLEYDDVIRSTLKDILNVALSDELWDQASLPVANGGLGIRRAFNLALPAFLSSVSGANILITQLLPQHLHTVSGTNDPSFIVALNDWHTRADTLPVQPPYPTMQKMWAIRS